MNIHNTISKICNLAEQFKQSEHKSFKQMLMEIDSREKLAAIEINDIRDYLKNKTSLIESWFLYSMDKRTGEGWYLMGDDKAKYKVGYLCKGCAREQEEYSDAAHACAVFIHKELMEMLGKR